MRELQKFTGGKIIVKKNKDNSDEEDDRDDREYSNNNYKKSFIKY
jgi:hypothetical protein